MQSEKSATTYKKIIDTLYVEARSIEAAAARLSPEALAASMDILQSCRGKVIVTGVGKSGIIAEKIAQTMTSTGTMAVFVHPSDALHGGLGVVTGDDVVITLSNSGETEEMIALMPTLRSRGVPIILLAGNLASTLAQQADVVLDASVDREACPLNLAPTASTTVALAIGDGLAMALMEAKGLSTEDFAANHPAGRLGKRLTIRVADLMHPSPDIAPDAGWLAIVAAISRHSLGAVNVVDENARLLGIITDGDLRRTIERTAAAELSSATATTMMTPQPVTATPEMLAYDSLRLMEERSSQISVLPVVDHNGRVVGMLRLHDIVRAGV